MAMVQIEDKTVKLTNLDKLLWPEDGITKAEFINYLAEISSVILPYLKDRPMVFTRYPDGIHGESFYQKNCPDYAPDWIKTIKIMGSERSINYILINDVRTLIWCANQASIELHPWHSRINSINYPDYAIFDLDPMEDTNFNDARELALALKKALDLQGIRSYPKTSGSTGIQVYVPIENKYTYSQVKKFTHFFSKVVAGTFPEKATIVRKVKEREGKVYMDYLQNIKGKTIVAPYCPRPNAGATVSTPLTWDELKDKKINPENFTIKNIIDRVKDKGDLFNPILNDKQNIDSIIHYIEKNSKL